MTVVVLSVAGSIGALARYLVSGVVQGGTRSLLPVGTAFVNLTGALALGLVIGAGEVDAVQWMAAAGFIGGFTTFSTWMVETAHLGVVPRPSARAAFNLVVLSVVGVALAAIGFYSVR